MKDIAEHFIHGSEGTECYSKLTQIFSLKHTQLYKICLCVCVTWKVLPHPIMSTHLLSAEVCVHNVQRGCV